MSINLKYIYLIISSMYYFYEYIFVCNKDIMPPCTSSFIILEKYSCPNHDFELATFSFLFRIALSNPILLFSCGPGGRSPDRVKGQYPMLGVQVGKAPLVVICYKFCSFTFAPFFFVFVSFFQISEFEDSNHLSYNSQYHSFTSCQSCQEF